MPVRNNRDGFCLRYYEMLLAHNKCDGSRTRVKRRSCGQRLRGDDRCFGE